MLQQFNFKNFKSFRDETSLDMSAANISELDHHITAIGSERLLPVSVILGGNASGKSNVFHAFEYMRDYVLNSFGYGDETVSTQRYAFTPPYPFLLDTDSRKQPTLFEVFFIDSTIKKDTSYQYGFTVGEAGIEEEWLNYRAKSSKGDYRPIFRRDGNQLEFSGKLEKKYHENLRVSLSEKTLAVSLGAKLQVPRLSLVHDWFAGIELLDYGNPYENFFRATSLPDGLAEDERVQDRVLRYLSTFDSSIRGFRVEPIPSDSPEDKKRYRVEALHSMNDSVATASVPLSLESAGTLKMFSLFSPIERVLKNGGVLFVDELNARLHPLLVRNLIITFTNIKTNPNHAQLIFTSHDVWVLTSGVLRRDEIWFTEKNGDGASELFALTDFEDEQGNKIRKDESFLKNYMVGKYGAIPDLRPLNMFLED